MPTLSNVLVSGLGGAAGYGETIISRNDDGFQQVNLSAVFENGLNFFGQNYTTFFVNTNGSISFRSGISQYTPSSITGGSTPMIAPFWADIDTRTPSSIGAQSAPIYVDVDAVSDTVTITWPGVNYFATRGDLQNFFQMQLVDRGSGNFDIIYRYENINWTTGNASGGTGGLGGTPARVGWTNGAGEYIELPASGNQSALLALETTSGNSGIAGVWQWSVTNGAVGVPVQQLLTAYGEVGLLAMFANAAYHLETANGFERIVPQFNEVRPSGSGDRFYGTLSAAGVSWLTDEDLPTLSPRSPITGTAEFPSFGIQNGIFVNQNSAALVGRAQDALFIAFRGTNDNAIGVLNPVSSSSPPDVDDWDPVDQAVHFNRFDALIDAIGDYLTDHPELTTIYVTGHSLGAAMGQRLMERMDGDDRYASILFANPGAGFSLLPGDERIAQIWNTNDSILSAAPFADNSGTEIYFTPDIHFYQGQTRVGRINSFEATSDLHRGQLHTADYYTEGSLFLHRNGVDVNPVSRELTYNGRVYERAWYDITVIEGGSAFSIELAGNDIIGVGIDNDEIVDQDTGLLGLNDGILLGGGGNDRLFGNNGNDALLGGAGMITSTAGAATTTSMAARTTILLFMMERIHRMQFLAAAALIPCLSLIVQRLRPSTLQPKVSRRLNWNSLTLGQMLGALLANTLMALGKCCFRT